MEVKRSQSRVAVAVERPRSGEPLSDKPEQVQSTNEIRERLESIRKTVHKSLVIILGPGILAHGPITRHTLKERAEQAGVRLVLFGDGKRSLKAEEIEKLKTCRFSRHAVGLVHAHGGFNDKGHTLVVEKHGSMVSTELLNIMKSTGLRRISVLACHAEILAKSIADDPELTGDGDANYFTFGREPFSARSTNLSDLLGLIDAMGSSDKTERFSLDDLVTHHFSHTPQAIHWIKGGQSPGRIFKSPSFRGTLKGQNPALTRLKAIGLLKKKDLAVGGAKARQLHPLDAQAELAYVQRQLFHFSFRGDATSIRLLLKQGVSGQALDPDARSADGDTALGVASGMGHAMAVKVLLKQDGIDPDLTGPGGHTPLMRAASAGQAAVVRTLLESGVVNPNLENKGSTALMLAIKHGNKAVVEAMLAVDLPVTTSVPDVNAPNSAGTTPMAFAVAQKNMHAVMCLLAHPAFDLTIKGQRPKDLLKHVHDKEMRARLKSMTS